MIDGIASRPFSANTLPPPPKPERSFKNEIIEIARTRYALPRETVEGKIALEWLNQGGNSTPAKAERRDERRLGSILTENAPVIKKYPPQNAGGDFRKKPQTENSHQQSIFHAPEHRTPSIEKTPQNPIPTPPPRKPINISALKEALEKAKEDK